MFNGMIGGSTQQIYLQAYHIVVVDGIPITGFGEDDYISIKYDGGGAEIISGADGPAMRYLVKSGGQIGLSVLPTGKAFFDLAVLRSTQFSSSDRRLFSVVIMSGVEEVFSFAGCAFGDLPEFKTGGPRMSSRAFVINFLQGTGQPSSNVGG